MVDIAKSIAADTSSSTNHNSVFVTSLPTEERSIVMTTSVCLSASISPELRVRSSPNALRMLPVYVARPASGGVAICYVVPVLWVKTCLYITGGQEYATQ